MKVRIISAIVMVAIFVPFLIIGELPFAVLMGVLGMFGFYELMRVRETKKKFPFVLKLFAYFLVLAFSMYNINSIEFAYKFDYRVMAFIIFMFTSPMVFINNTKRYNLNDALFLIGSILFVGLSFNLIVITRNFDINYIIYLLLITAMTDTFALFTGMLIGKHKLCPDISPKKTIEGAVGGLIGSSLLAWLFGFIFMRDMALVCLVLGLVGGAAGMAGDLTASMFKRKMGIKDYGTLIPGHGGIMDRFDSVIFVAPVVYYAICALTGILNV